MKKQTTAEAHVLDRALHLLSEGSVSYLANQDHEFGDFIDELQDIITNKRLTLQY